MSPLSNAYDNSRLASSSAIVGHSAGLLCVTVLKGPFHGAKI